jgi:hypothetical protein
MHVTSKIHIRDRNISQNKRPQESARKKQRRLYSSKGDTVIPFDKTSDAVSL